MKSIDVIFTDEELANAKFPMLNVVSKLRAAGIPLEGQSTNWFEPYSSLFDIRVKTGVLICEFQKPGENLLTFRWKDASTCPQCGNETGQLYANLDKNMEEDIETEAYFCADCKISWPTETALKAKRDRTAKHPQNKEASK